MPPARKSKRQAKPPAKLEEFVCQDGLERDKDGEPRRSRRTPKVSEKLKSYMDNKVVVKRGKPDEKPSEPVIKKPTKPAGSPSKQPRVLLQPLPKSLFLPSPKETSKNLRVSKVPMKRHSGLSLGKSSPPKFSKAVPNVTARASPSTSNSKAGNRAVKRKLERDRSARMRGLPVEPKWKKIKTTESQTTETIRTGQGIVYKDDDLIPRVNKDILNKLIGFGAEIAEAIDSNSEAIVSLSAEGHKPRRNILDTIKSDKSRELTDDDVNAILKWLDDEEDQRRAYRKRILESLRASHEINMALYNQMLQVLQSVTLSV